MRLTGTNSAGHTIESAAFTLQLRTQEPNLAATISRSNALLGLAYAKIAYLNGAVITQWARSNVSVACPACAQAGRAVRVRYFKSSDDTDFYVMTRQDGMVVVGFRGTESSADGSTDIATAPAGYAGCTSCALHTGFMRAYAGIVNQLASFLHEALPSEIRGTTPVVVAGHSLGGALATIASYELALAGYNVVGVYTYGSPRVGNAHFASAFNRVVALGDGAGERSRLPSASRNVLRAQLQSSSNGDTNATSGALVLPMRPSVLLSAAVGLQGHESDDNATFWKAWDARVSSLAGAPVSPRSRNLAGAGSYAGFMSGVWRFVNENDAGSSQDMVPDVPPAGLGNAYGITLPGTSVRFDSSYRFTHITPRVCIVGGTFRQETNLIPGNSPCSSKSQSPLGPHYLDGYLSSLLHGARFEAGTFVILSRGSNGREGPVVLSRSSSSPTPSISQSPAPACVSRSLCSRSGRVAQFSNSTFSCSGNRVITAVRFASYGLPSFSSCTPTGMSANVACNAESSVSIVESICLGKKSCTLFADNSVFGNPCRNVRKYLTVHLTCSSGCVSASSKPRTL